MQESRKNKKAKKQKNKIITFTIPFSMEENSTKINTSNNSKNTLNIKEIISAST